MILLITSSFDKTCDYILSKFSKLNFFRMNVDKFSEYQLEFTPNGFRIENHNSSVSSLDCSAIYFRKPTLENLNERIDAKYHDFVHKESYSLIEGIIEYFPNKCLSKPSILRRSNNKVFQAILSQEIGFNIPRYSITNDKCILRDWAKEKNNIVKPLAIGTVESKGTKEFVQTNLLLPNLDDASLKYAPVYLQEFIDKDYEVRVTVINGHFFAARIDSNNHIDWRKPDNSPIFTRLKLSDDIKDKCRNFMNECGMEFGCFDFLIKDEIWYFLEMNANGQWGWLDPIFDGKISDEIINYLGKS